MQSPYSNFLFMVPTMVGLTMFEWYNHLHSLSFSCILRVNLLDQSRFKEVQSIREFSPNISFIKRSKELEKQKKYHLRGTFPPFNGISFPRTWAARRILPSMEKVEHIPFMCPNSLTVDII